MNVTLPTKKSKARTSLSDYVILLYGEPGIGKTTLCAQFEDMLMLMCEPGAKGLEVYEREIETWEELVAYRDLLKKDETFKSVAVDTADVAYSLCLDYVCAERGIDYPPENDFGKTWKAIEAEFTQWVRSFMRMNKGVIFTSHASLKTVQRRDGSSFDKLRPTLSGQAMRVLEGLADFIFYYGYTAEGGHELTIRGDSFIDAKTRPPKQFLTSKKKRPVHTIDMGETPQEAYENLVAAFNNELTKVGNVPYVKQRKRRN